MPLPLIPLNTLDDYAKHAIHPHFMNADEADGNVMLTIVSLSGCVLQSRPMAVKTGPWDTEQVWPEGGTHKHTIDAEKYQSRRWRVEE